MPDHTEQQLLKAFIANGDEQAFAGLVRRHLNMVLGSAVRLTSDRGLAEEVAQKVFTILARKAHRLKSGAGLAGWLHKTTLYESQKALRATSRRQRKMTAFAEQNQPENENAPSEPGSDTILPQVDAAMDELSDGDRQLVVMHYLEGQSFSEIASQLGKTAGASQKQASRAMAKLRAILNRRGVVASATVLGSVLLAESAKAAPMALANTISGSAVAGASSLSASTLIANTIQTMTYAKTKVALLVAATAAVPLGAQMKTNNDLKQDLQSYREQEVQYAAQGERLARIEQKIASLPAASRQAFEDWDTSFVAARSPSGSPALSALNSGASKRAGLRTGQGSMGATPIAADVPPELTGIEAVLDESFGSLEEMLKNPAMRQMVRKQMAATLESTHGDLLDHFELGEEGRDKVMKVMLDHDLGLVAAADKSDSAPDDESADKYDEQLMELLGKERFETLELFDKSEPQRMELATYRSLLEEQGKKLEFDLEQQLMAIMFEEQNPTPEQIMSEVLAGSSLTPEENVLAAEIGNIENGIISPEASAAVVSDQRRIQIRIEARVAELLTPEQLEIFKLSQESHLKLMRQGLDAVELIGD